MTYRIHITRIAEQDLNDAADYIEYILKNPSAADHLLELVESRISTLETNPEIHAIVDDPVLKAWEIRFVVINNYLAFYTIDELEGIVYVVRFLCGKRELITILKQGISFE